MKAKPAARKEEEQRRRRKKKRRWLFLWACYELASLSDTGPTFPGNRQADRLKQGASVARFALRVQGIRSRNGQQADEEGRVRLCTRLPPPIVALVSRVLPAAQDGETKRNMTVSSDEASFLSVKAVALCLLGMATPCKHEVLYSCCVIKDYIEVLCWPDFYSCCLRCVLVLL